MKRMQVKVGKGYDTSIDPASGIFKEHFCETHCVQSFITEDNCTIGDIRFHMNAEIEEVEHEFTGECRIRDDGSWEKPSLNDDGCW